MQGSILFKEYEEKNEQDNEYNKWIDLFNDIISIKHDNNTQMFKLYAKGGTILGIKVLKMLLTKDSDTFDKDIIDLINLNLIKDWDFIIYPNGETKEDIGEIITSVGEKKGFQNEATSMVVIRYNSKSRFKLKSIDGRKEADVLFELAVKNNENLSESELPMTMMKILITKDNIDKIFSLAQHFFLHNTCGLPIDANLIKRYMADIDVIVPKADNGMFDVLKVDEGCFSKEMLDIINNYVNNICVNDNIQNRKNIKQLIISQLKEPDRIFDRLIGKNIPKSDKIRIFLHSKQILAEESWLIDGEKIGAIIKGFVEELQIIIQQKFNSILPEINRVTNIVNNLKAHLVLSEEANTRKTTYRELKSLEQDEFVKDKMNSILINASFNMITCNYEHLERTISEKKLDEYVSKGYLSNIRKLHQCYSQKKYIIPLDQFIEKSLELFTNINIPRLGGKYSEFNKESKQLVQYMAPKMTDDIRRIIVPLLHNNTKIKGNKSAISGFYMTLLKSGEYNVL